MCAAAFALLWPHARDAGAVLIAQDDPARLSDLRLDSAFRNDPALAIDWPIDAAPILSGKDTQGLALADAPVYD